MTIEQIRILIDSNKIDIAEKEINLAISEDIDNGDLFQLLTEVQLQKDENKKALESISKAIELDPENPFFFYTLARVQVNLNLEKAALESIDIAIDKLPFIADFWSIKSLILINLTKRKEGRIAALKGLELEPDHILCKNLISMIDGIDGNVLEAKGQLLDMLEENPEDELTHTNLGYNFLMDNKPKKAKEHFAIALEKDPENEYTRSGMIEAIKSTNFLYMQYFKLQLWFQKIGSKLSWVFIISLIVIVKIFPFLLPFYLLFIVWIWFIEPLSNIILYFDKYGKYLMNKRSILSTKIALSLLAISILNVVFSIPKFELGSLGFSLAAFATVIPVNAYFKVYSIKSKIMNIIFVALFFLPSLFAMINYYNGVDAFQLYFVSIISAVAYSWLGNIFE